MIFVLISPVSAYLKKILSGCRPIGQGILKQKSLEVQIYRLWDVVLEK